jgi:hypothetical protein
MCRRPTATRGGFASGQAAAQAVADRIDTLGAGQTAAVIMEPNAGTNGIVPPADWWPALRRVTRERGVWLIADEVMSGFGRCGHWFAWQKQGLEQAPDLITCAKGLTGAAAPLGAVIVSAAVYERIRSQTLMAGLTYLRPPAGLCRRAGRRARLPRRRPDRALAPAGRVAFRAAAPAAAAPCGDRRRARRRRPVCHRRPGGRPQHARAAGALAADTSRRWPRCCATRSPPACPSPAAATC